MKRQRLAILAFTAFISSKYLHMKSRTFFGMMVMLLALVGMTACSNDDDPLDNPMQGEIDPALLEQTTPEFSQSDFESIYESFYEWTTSTNGTWTITKLNGIVCSIVYWGYGQEEHSPEPPKTAEVFFKDNLPMTDDDKMAEADGWHSSRYSQYYWQYYKGIKVERGFWEILFTDGLIASASGYFVVINNLDIAPLISEENAKKIVASYIKESVDGKDKCFYLAIMEFPAETKLEPRLVYVYKYDPWEYHNYVYVDAKTGRLLYQIKCTGGKPYY